MRAVNASLAVGLHIMVEIKDPIALQSAVADEDANFANFPTAFITLFCVVTGDGWNGLMHDAMVSTLDEAPRAPPTPVLHMTTVLQMLLRAAPSVSCCAPLCTSISDRHRLLA